MPELPEVETIRRTLAPLVVGRRVESVEVLCGSLRRPIQPDFASRLSARTVMEVRRRAKYLIFDLDDGTALIAHLGMSGRLLHRDACDSTARVKHDHVVLRMEGGGAVFFNDPRRFGLLVIDDPGTCDLLAELGPEPLDRERFDQAYLEAWRTKTRRTVKAVLMDQHVVAGLGNIYVNEILFVAGLRPRRRFSRLTRAQCGALVQATRQILREAIDHRGSTIADFLDGIGRRGGYQWRRRVYDRAGEACPVCGTPIRGIVVGQRSTFYCRQCQR